MESSLEPTQHVLRPHHVGLLSVFLLVFQHHEGIRVPSRLLLHIHRVLLNEVAEMSEPKGYQELIHEIGSGVQPPPLEAIKLVEALQAMPSHLHSAAMLTSFFHDVPALYRCQDNSDEEEIRHFDPKSIFGYFCRRCFVTFGKLSYLGVIQLQQDFQAWVKGDKTAGYHSAKKDVIRNDEYILRPQVDKEPWGEPHAFGDFERAHADGDLQVATESLRRFFEQRFNSNNDSEFRQHAMLNLVRMHMATGQYSAARKLVLEAITVARTQSDNVVLQQCMSLLRRLQGASRGKKEPLSELQSDIAPMDVLFDVTKLMAEGQPIGDSFEKLIQALGIYDLSRDFRGGPPNQDEQWAFHAVQSVLWRMAGCERLADIEENIVLIFCESGGNDDSRCKILLNRAQMLAQRGDEAGAFGLLLDPETWRGLDYGLNQVAAWSREVWSTMALFAARRGQTRQVDDFLKPHRPLSLSGLQCFFLRLPEKEEVGPYIEQQLSRVLALKSVNQSLGAVDHLLKALWQSEYQGRFYLYRLSIILLADMGLELGMTDWSRRLMEEIIPQVISGDSVELRAFACFVLARCIIACCGKNYTRLYEALPYLQISENDYRTLDMQSALQDVLFVISILYHNLGDVQKRDAAAARHAASVKEQSRLESLIVNDGWRDIWSLVSEISTALATR